MLPHVRAGNSELPRVPLAESGRLREVPALAAVLALAGGVAIALNHSVALALVVAALPLVPLMLSRPAVAGVLGVATLPVSIDLLGGGPVRVSLPDVLLTVSLLGTLAVGTSAAWRAVRPVVPFALVYAATLALALAVHADAQSLVNGAQRMQILLVPLVIGAVTLRRGALSRALSGYVLVATAMGLVFSADIAPASFALQKNPVGQYVVGALLVVVADRGPRWRWACVPLLAYGLFQTQSRGALLGLVLGILALLVVGVGASRARTAAVLLPILAVLALTYASLPDDVQHRTTTISAGDPGSASSAQYTIRIRAAYRSDALRIVSEHPFQGVGVSHYLSGDLLRGTLTTDPHNVLLLEAAEGGLPLLGGFLVLVIGSWVMVWRRRRDTPLAALALAVQVSTIGHGCVDIYWVRGTPVLGWLLVGAALADAHRRRTQW